MEYFVYGMRLRGFAPGCQPMNGLIDSYSFEWKAKYHSLLVYSRKLTDAEVKDYELDFINGSVLSMVCYAARVSLSPEGYFS